MRRELGCTYTELYEQDGSDVLNLLLCIDERDKRAAAARQDEDTLMEAERRDAETKARYRLLDGG